MEEMTLNNIVMRIGEIIRHISKEGDELILSAEQINKILAKINEIAVIFNCADILKIVVDLSFAERRVD